MDKELIDQELELAAKRSVRPAGNVLLGVLIFLSGTPKNHALTVKRGEPANNETPTG